jgi:hypothetical protein
MILEIYIDCLNGFKWVVFVMDTDCVLCKVGIEILHTIR